jgi:DNA-binding transcriptional LysR family regulator
MDRRQLLAFVAVAEELHFSKAAQRLRLTQPALSQQIARLEAALDVRLFERNPKRVALTDAGRVFLEETRELLRRMDRSLDLAKRAAAGRIGHLTVAFVEASPYGILPHLMLAYRRAMPSVMVTLVESLSSDQIEAIAAGRVDAGLLRPLATANGIERLKLHAEPYLVALPKTHRLAELREIPIAALDGEDLITTPPPQRRYIESRFRARFEKAGVTLNIVQEVQQLHTTVGLVGAGMGIGIVPRSVTRLRLDGVVYRPFVQGDSPDAELHLAWKRDNPSKTLAGFLAVARKFAKSG